MTGALMTRLRQMVEDGRADDLGWSNDDSHEFVVDDPTEQDPRGIGILVYDDTAVMYGRSSSEGQVEDVVEVVGVLDRLDRRQE